MFHFKQFSVNQSGCAMKINTDGVLLGAMVNATDPHKILDIGTGTGVIALMLAQRFNNALIDAVEVDKAAAETAGGNFEASVFKDQLTVFDTSIEAFFEDHPDVQYDLIVSNPPFYTGSLKSPEAKINLAKHTDADFFDSLMKNITSHLSKKGECWLVLPIQTAVLVNELAMQNGLYLQRSVTIKSFENSEPHRKIVCFGFDQTSPEATNFTIYKAVGAYSEAYMQLLQPYFINF